MNSLLGQPCDAHKVHTPRHLTSEWHHIIPVAWQLHTVVATPPFPGVDPEGRGMLWDSRGVFLCPTGHRNVHHWIVALMHALANADSDDPAVALRIVKPHRAPTELTIAVEALTRYVEEAGTSLLALTAAGEWGQS